MISPDAALETSEIGVPTFMCKVLGFPESVNDYNIEEMRRCVVNGNAVHPGASVLWVPDGELYNRVDLGAVPQKGREQLARQLCSPTA